MAIVLGLMGYFASGKSTAAKYLVKKGFYEIDADLIGKGALKSQKDEIVSVFSTDILDSSGYISPKLLGDIVFNNEGEIGKLNFIVHKWIKEEIRKKIEELKQKKILINAAILPQLKLQEFCDKILMIRSDEKIILSRGLYRNNFSPKKVYKILEMQKKYNDYFRYADYQIVNNNTEDTFYAKLDEFYNKFLEGENGNSGWKSGI